MECTIRKPRAGRQVPSAQDSVILRQVPYPYRAMLAICSDLDETPDRQTYWEIMRFLNSVEETTMGKGANLEVGNSIYFDMPPDQFAYWNTDDAGRHMIRTLIRSGHVDCLHSYGDLATTRAHAQRALEELVQHGCHLNVWIDHGTAPTNFDPDIMRGHGDEIGHDAYHADLTTDYGIQFVWRGRVTSITGQDVPPSLKGILQAKHPLASSRTLVKEVAKRHLARNGNGKYAMHRPNRTLRRSHLRDGKAVYEFMRCNPHWGGVSSCDKGREIGHVLTDRLLQRLVQTGGTCILYTHLGKIDNPAIPFDEKAIGAFRRVAAQERAERILVTTTSRLLRYRRTMSEITYSVSSNGNGLTIYINTHNPQTSCSSLPAVDLSGLTFYVSNPEATEIVVDGHRRLTAVCNVADHAGRRSISVPWPRLEFPQI